MSVQKTLRFDNQSQQDFVKTLNNRVNDYFKTNNISKNANLEMVLKTIFHLTLWIGSYLLYILGDFNFGTNLAICALLGFSIAMVGVNIAHDAIHGSYSQNKWVNIILSHCFNFNGASAYMWKKMHNVAHHTYTNIDGFDEDIESVPIIRMSPQKKLRPIHKYQYLFSFFIYGLATISWVFIKDYKKFFKNEVGNYNGESHPKIEYFYLFFYKIINYTIFIIIPFSIVEAPWWQLITCFLVMHYVAGFTLALIFMLAHVVEETHFPIPTLEGTINNTWAAHQLYTTADFSAKSYLAGFLTGGLNTQVEHHLFPNICHIHYRKLSTIVQQTAEEFNLPYFDAPFSHAVKSHINFLKRMGLEENYQPKGNPSLA